MEIFHIFLVKRRRATMNRDYALLILYLKFLYMFYGKLYRQSYLLDFFSLILLYVYVAGLSIHL